jgi:hypothetical protein
MAYVRIHIKSGDSKSNSKEEKRAPTLNIYQMGTDCVKKIMYFADLKSVGCLSGTSRFFNERCEDKNTLWKIEKELSEKKLPALSEKRKELLKKLRDKINNLGDWRNRSLSDHFKDPDDNAHKIPETALLRIVDGLYSLNRCNEAKDILLLNPLVSLFTGGVGGGVIGGLVAFFAAASGCSSNMILKVLGYGGASTGIAICLGMLLYGSYYHHSFYKTLDERIKPLIQLIQRIYNIDERISVLENHIKSFSKENQSEQTMLAQPQSFYHP